MNISIERLCLENFKCHRHLQIDFGGRSAEIRGDNATGKSSVYDALTWLLFGKDSHGASNFEIKPLGPDGEVADHEAITAVECALQVDGTPMVLRKTLKEAWSSRRGSRELVYTGNTMEYFVDGVPAKKSEFDKRVGELCSEDTFRLLTSVSWFPDGLPWQKRREVLMSAFGCITDADIMEANEILHPLLEATGNRPLEDSKKLWTARRKSLNSAKTDIPVRLDELARSIRGLEGVDYQQAETELESAQANLDNLNRKLMELDNGTDVKTCENALKEASYQLDSIIRENAAFRRAQNTVTVDTALLERAVRYANTAVANLRAEENSVNATIAFVEKTLDDGRKMWAAANAETFRGADCPTCGQPLPADKLRAAKERFETQKRAGLHRIEANAAMDKDRIARSKSRLEEITEELKNANNRLAEVTSELEAAKAQSKVEVHDMPDYQERRSAAEKEVTRLENELFSLRSNTARERSNLQSEASEVKAVIGALNRTLATRDLISEYKARMDGLREDARKATEELEAIDRLLELCEDFVRIKADMLEASINRNFRLAHFRLFRTQANGGIEDRCDVTYNGVPYGSLNSGMRINVGVDIINTLSTLHGITVPLFIDNAESVTALEPCRAQTIRLVVDEAYKEVFVNG